MIKKRGIVICMMMLLAGAGLFGCGGDGENDGGPALLSEAMGLLEASNAYSYRAEQMIQGGGGLYDSVSEINVIYEPYAYLAQSTSRNQEGEQFSGEIYQRVNADGSMDVFLRNGEVSGGAPGEWAPNHIPPETARIVLASAKEGVRASAELLKANEALFKEAGKESVEGRSAVLLKGAVTPDSAAQIYNDHFRTYYRQIGLVEDRDLTDEEAKEEIVTGGLVEMESGIPSLAFSPDNIPVTVWIDEETHVPVKVEVDYTAAAQAIQGGDQVDLAVATYTISALEPDVTVPAPEGLE